MSKKENLLKFWESVEKRDDQVTREKVVMDRRLHQRLPHTTNGEQLKACPALSPGQMLPSLPRWRHCTDGDCWYISSDRNEILMTSTKTRARREKKQGGGRPGQSGDRQEAQPALLLTPPAAASEFCQRWTLHWCCWCCPTVWCGHFQAQASPVVLGSEMESTKWDPQVRLGQGQTTSGRWISGEDCKKSFSWHLPEASCDSQEVISTVDERSFQRFPMSELHRSNRKPEELQKVSWWHLRWENQLSELRAKAGQSEPPETGERVQWRQVSCAPSRPATAQECHLGG